MSGAPASLKVGGRYNWRGQPERLAYMGARTYHGASRSWHQFEKVDQPGVVWSEVLDSDLESFEETVTPAEGVRVETGGAVAPQAPIKPHQLVSDVEYLRIFEDARHGSSKPVGTLRGIRAVIAAYEMAAPAAASTTGQADGGDVDTLRADGWSVAVHNDYRLDGVPHTFWLFTKDGRAVQGEGRTDAAALAQVRAALAQPGSGT